MFPAGRCLKINDRRTESCTRRPPERIFVFSGGFLNDMCEKCENLPEIRFETAENIP